MRSHKEQIKDMGLPIFLGYDDNNQPLIVDLTKVGHILVEGATGQGKTNMLHTFAQSIYYAPRKVYEGCVVSYIHPECEEEPRPYFDFYLTTMEEIREELEMLCDKIEKRMNDPKLARYPVMVLCDEIAYLVTGDKRFAEMFIYIAERGHLVGIHLVVASRHLFRRSFGVA